MHQYTDNGRLNGYTNPLDLDIFYGDYDDWNNIAKKVEPEPTPSPDPGDNEWLLDWIEYLTEERTRIDNKIDELRRRLK
jgi:hypothetical protein